jgi:hypothetical protein
VTDLSVANYTPVAGLADGVWYWQVKAKSQTGNNSGYQAIPFVFTLDTVIPNIPFLLNPSDDSSVCDNTPLFVWTQSVGRIATPVTYTLQYCLSPSFSNPITIEGIAYYFYTMPDSMSLDDTTYYWRVEAVDMANNHSGYQAHSYRFRAFFLGDINRDGLLTVADVVYLINYLFKGGPVPDPLMRGDVNHDGKATIADGVFLVCYLFKGGPRPRCLW